jgi:ferritin
MAHIKFKTEKEKLEFPKIKSTLTFILLDMASYFNANGFDFVITDVLSEVQEDKKLKRISSSHREGRAVDVRVHDIPEEFLKTFEEKFERIYRNEAAISSKTGEPNLIVRHNVGAGDHLHIQVKKS